MKRVADVKLSFDKTELTKMVTKLDDVGKAAMRGAEAGMRNTVDLIYARAKSTVPVKTGYLRESMYKEVEINGYEISGGVGHGGRYNKYNIHSMKFTDEYAVEVHEDGFISRESGRMGSTSKWLEKAFNSTSKTLMPVMQEHISAAIQGRSASDLNSQIAAIYQQIAEQNRKKIRRPKKDPAAEYLKAGLKEIRDRIDRGGE